MRRKQSPSEIPMELISLGFMALYFRGGRTLFTTRLSSGINHKSTSWDSSPHFVPFRFVVSSTCLSRSSLPSVFVPSRHIPL